MSWARFLPRFRGYSACLSELGLRESWSAETMRRWQLDRLNDLWARASSQVPYYRQLAATLSLPARFESLLHYTTTMPVLGKDAVRRRAEDFRSPDAPRGRWHFSSGSTGIPMRFYRSHATHQAMLCHQYRFREIWGLNLFDRAAFFGTGTPRFADVVSRTRQNLTDRLRNRLRLSVHQLSPAALARHLQRIDQFQPAYIYGYSRAIHLLALEAIQQHFLCPSLKVVMMTSEPAFPHMIRTVERAFAAPAVMEYGSVECGVIAYEWRDRTLRVCNDRVLLEALPREDGRFDLVITVLDNPDFPLLRYRIEDVTDAALGAPAEAFPILHNIAGRNDDVLFAGDGSVVHPAEIDGIFEMNDRLAVRRYRLHQQPDGAILVQVEPAGADRIETRAIGDAVSKVVPGRDVRVEIVEAIVQSAAGKHRLITSDFARAG